MIIKVENELRMGKLTAWFCSSPLLGPCFRQVVPLVAYHGVHDILNIVFNSNDAYVKSN